MEVNRLDTLSPGHSPNQTPTWTWKSFSRGVSLDLLDMTYSFTRSLTKSNINMNVKIIFPWSFPWKRGMPLQPLHHQAPPSPTLFHRKGFANLSLETSKKVGEIKGNGLGPGERCETKWRIFPKKNGRIFGWMGLEPRNLKMFGFVQAGHVLWDFKTVSPSALTSSGPQASSGTRSLSSDSFGVVRKRKLSAESRGWRRQERKKDGVWLS